MRDSSSGSPSETTGMCVASSIVCRPKTASKASSRAMRLRSADLLVSCTTLLSADKESALTRAKT